MVLHPDAAQLEWLVPEASGISSACPPAVVLRCHFGAHPLFSRQAHMSRVSNIRSVFTGWVPKIITTSIHFISLSLPLRPFLFSFWASWASLRYYATYGYLEGTMIDPGAAANCTARYTTTIRTTDIKSQALRSPLRISVHHSQDLANAEACYASASDESQLAVRAHLKRSRAYSRHAGCATKNSPVHRFV
jgi:hypothetical protein